MGSASDSSIGEHLDSNGEDQRDIDEQFIFVNLLKIFPRILCKSPCCKEIQGGSCGTVHIKI